MYRWSWQRQYAWVDFASLSDARSDVLEQWVHTGCSNIRVVCEVLTGAKFGAGFSSFFPAVELIVDQRVDAGCGDVWILLEIPGGVEEGIWVASVLPASSRHIVVVRT